MDRVMKIDNIVFDFGGVLLDWNPRYLFEDLFDDEKEMEYFLSNVCTLDWNAHQDAGRSLAEGTKLLQAQFPEYKLMIQKYYDHWEIMLKDQIPENTKLLKPLKDLEYRLFGLTNWSGETFPIALKRYAFFEAFEGIVVSGNEKMIKPNKEIFHLLINRHDINPEHSIFIDDNSDNIQAAREIGFHTIHYEGNVNLEHELRKLGIMDN